MEFHLTAIVDGYAATNRIMKLSACNDISVVQCCNLCSSLTNANTIQSK